MINVDQHQCEYKIIPVCENDYVWKPAKCNCGIGKYLASIKDDSAIICDKVIESYVERNKFNWKESNL